VMEQAAALSLASQYAALMRAAYTAAGAAFTVAGQPFPQLAPAR
jgi:hypothetical protein